MSTVTPESLKRDWSPDIFSGENGTHTWRQKGALFLPGEVDFTPLVEDVTRRRLLQDTSVERFSVARTKSGGLCVDKISDRKTQWPLSLTDSMNVVLEQLEPVVEGVFDIYRYRFGHMVFENEALGGGDQNTLLHLDSRVTTGVNAIIASQRPTVILKDGYEIRGLDVPTPPTGGALNDLFPEYVAMITPDDLESHQGVALFGNNSSIHQKPPIGPNDNEVRCLINLRFNNF